MPVANLSTSQKLGLLRPAIKWVFVKVWKLTPLWLSLKLILTIIPAGLMAIQTFVARELINALVAVTSGPNGSFNSVILWVVLTLVLAILQTAFTGGRQYASRRLNEILQINITLEVLDHASKLEVAIFEDPALQDTLERAQANIAGNINNFINQIFSLITTIISAVSIVAILVVIDPIAALLLFPISIPYLLFYWRQSHMQYVTSRNRTTRRRWIRYYSQTMLDNTSVPEVRILDLARPMTDRYKNYMEEFIEEDRGIYSRQIVGDILFASLFAASLAIATGWIAWRVFQGLLTVGDLVVYGRATLQLQSTIQNSSSSITSMLEQAMYVSDLIEYLNLKPGLYSDVNHIPEKIDGEVRFEDVSFTYPGSKKRVLHHVSFTIPAGKVVALVGENGSGKSTIAKLAARLYNPEAGAIYLDDRRLGDYDLDYLYRQIGFVFQNANQYEASVSENIAYGNWRELMGNQAQIEAIAKQVGIDGMIREMPEGYETLLGRKFSDYDLSGGQWQKITIARAFTRDASLLILDEPTANIDARAEYEIFSNFKELSRGRTTLLISHRFSTVRLADHIIVIDKGRVIEQGSHEELMAMDRHYAGLFKLHSATLSINGNKSDEG
jgi:ATP-binding cassette subfamily B protein